MNSKKDKKSSCPVTAGEVDLTRYAQLDENWRQLGIAAPARRALIDANIFKLADLNRISLDKLSKLHGMGPKTIRTLIAAGAKFKD